MNVGRPGKLPAWSSTFTSAFNETTSIKQPVWLKALCLICIPTLRQDPLIQLTFGLVRAAFSTSLRMGSLFTASTRLEDIPL